MLELACLGGKYQFCGRHTSFRHLGQVSRKIISPLRSGRRTDRIGLPGIGQQPQRTNQVTREVIRSDGSIFFTDPEGTIPRERRELGFSAVFRIAPDGQLHLATNECEYPNGLAFSPDESDIKRP